MEDCAMKELLLPATAAFLAAAVPAMASPPAPQRATASEEVRIPFASFGAIRNFRPQGDAVVYLEGTHRRWYRAELNGPCINLPNALRIGFDARFNGDTLDNTSTLLVEGEHCRISSLVRVDGPPARRPRR
jgi:hypothetical protein